MIVAASEKAILMVEGEAKNLPEGELLEAIDFAHGHIKEYCRLLSKVQEEIGREKRKFQSRKLPPNLFRQLKTLMPGKSGIA